MSSLYDKGREGFLTGSISWTGDTIRALLVAADYVPDLAAHQFLSDIAVGYRVATSSPLTGKMPDAGVADAHDVLFTSVTGVAVAALVLYQDTGIAATSRLLAYLDNVVGIPFSPSGADVQVVWSNTADRIFKL